MQRRLLVHGVKADFITVKITISHGDAGHPDPTRKGGLKHRGNEHHFGKIGRY